MQQWICRTPVNRGAVGRICKTPVSREAAGQHAAVNLQGTSQRRSSRISCSSGSAGHQSAEKQQDIMQQWICRTSGSRTEQDTRQQRISRTSGRRGAAGHQDADAKEHWLGHPKSPSWNLKQTKKNLSYRPPTNLKG